jgi:predicted ribosomally synthesized peptide with nif11-like leader
MSLDQAKAAINHLRTDNVFKEKIMAIHDVSKRIQLINESGFHCTIEDFNHLIKIDVEIADLKCDKMVYSWLPTKK